MKRIKKENSVFDYNRKNRPCLYIHPGEMVTFEVRNRFRDAEDLASVLEEKRGSPLFSVTGPLYIHNALPGKTLKVKILDIRLTSKKGYCVLLPGRGCFAKRIKKNHIRLVHIGKTKAQFTPDISFPLSPMVGRIGVAPRRGSILSNLPGPHGGNLDCKEAAVGSTIYLPIFVEGGLLALGDIHAAMGDGEIGLSGVETEGEVTVRCSVVDDFPIQEPWVATKKEVMALASASSVEKASKKALSYLGNLLQSRLHLSFEESIMLMSAAANVGICQMVNPLVTVKASITRSVLDLG